MTTDNMLFTFSDTIAGYVTFFETDDDSFGLRTADGREFRCSLTPTTYAQITRNLGGNYRDVTGNMQNMLVPGRYVFAFGLFYPENQSHRFEVKSLTFPSVGGEFVFESHDWWIDQARAIGDFYLNGQFPDGNYDWRNYRTELYLNGTHMARPGGGFRQENNTISRMIYGLASAYLLTGEDRFLDAAQKGTDYLRDHMRATDNAEGVVYWYHAIDVQGDDERKIYASEHSDAFSNDYDAIPMYEQVYALAGPTQLYRITGDPHIRDDIEKTIRLFDRFFKDDQLGGYFSHLDPVTFDPRAESLGTNRARKNWNSTGDHAPAYLINLVLATGEERFGDFLIETADTIQQRFPDDTPFVLERFHEDWSPDPEYVGQQNRAVVGHNLKIAWNLMRMHHYRPNDAYVKLAEKIAATMPPLGSDQQRGGWYDVIERMLAPGQTLHRFVYHDRKPWWQQEQAILAYLILAGSLGSAEYERLAMESAAFYNTWFLDHDDGGVYFLVLANGLPYLLGTERLKGSHSQSCYHSIELCYLACVYTNLLLRKEPLVLHFRPQAAAFPDGILRVAPDLLPPGSVELSEVWVDDAPYTDFDREALTVRLPETDRAVKVRVRVAPTGDPFDSTYELVGGIAKITLRGDLSDDQVPHLRRDVERAIGDKASAIALLAGQLQNMAPEAVRQLMFLRSKLDVDDRADFYIVAANERIRSVVALVSGSNPEESDFIFVTDEAEVTR